MKMATLAQHIFQVDQRRAERDEIFVPTRLRRRAPPYGAPVDAHLVNISRFGFMARTDMEAIDGSLISIELPEIGEVKARAVWSMEYSVGGEFLAPIDPATYFNLLAFLSEERVFETNA